MFSFINNLIKPEKVWHVKCLDGDFTYKQLEALDDNLWDFISSDTTIDQDFAKTFMHRINWNIADKNKLIISDVATDVATSENANSISSPQSEIKSVKSDSHDKSRLIHVPDAEDPKKDRYLTEAEVKEYIKNTHDDEPPNILNLHPIYRIREYDARVFINERFQLLSKISSEKGYYFGYKTILPTKYYDEKSGGLVDMCPIIVDDYKDDAQLGTEQLEQHKENVLNFKTINRLNKIFCQGFDTFSLVDFIKYSDVIDFKHIMTMDKFNEYICKLTNEKVKDCIIAYKKMCDDIIMKYTMEKEITVQKMFVLNQPAVTKVDMNYTYDEIEEDTFWEFYNNR